MCYAIASSVSRTMAQRLLLLQLLLLQLLLLLRLLLLLLLLLLLQQGFTFCTNVHETLLLNRLLHLLQTSLPASPLQRAKINKHIQLQWNKTYHSKPVQNQANYPNSPIPLLYSHPLATPVEYWPLRFRFDMERCAPPPHATAR